MSVDLKAEMVRASEVRQILDSPVFVAARKNLEEQLASVRRGCPIRDTDMHTRVVLMEQLMGSFFNYFEQLAQTGRMAEMQLRQEEEKRSALAAGLAWFRTGGRN